MSDLTDTNLSSEELRQKINLETGKLGWPELQRYFASGMVIVIDPALDLVDVAMQISQDNASAISEWSESKLLWRAQDDDATRWQENSAEFWAVVIAPWVVVQEYVSH